MVLTSPGCKEDLYETGVHKKTNIDEGFKEVGIGFFLTVFII